MDGICTRPHTPRTNGKAERVIKTLMAEWHRRRRFLSREERRKFLYAYTRYYNQARPHQSLLGQSPIERLEAYLVRVRSVRKPVTDVQSRKVEFNKEAF